MNSKILSYIKTNINLINKFGFILLFVILSLALSQIYNCLDYDLWSRLAQGQAVIQSGHVLKTDIFSYSKTHIWYDPEWLSSVILYIIVTKFKIAGFNLFKGIFVALFGLSIVFVSRNYFKSIRYNSLYFLIPFLFISASSMTYFRCQYFTFIILPIWIYFLEKSKDNNKYLYYLPILMLIWLNIHAASMTGIMILILYGIGEFFNKKPYKKYFYILIPVLLVYFINPWGYKFVSFLYDSLFINRAFISEWHSPLKTSFPYSDCFLIYAFVVTIIYIFRIILKKFKNINYIKLLIYILFFISSLMYLKLCSLFVIISFIYNFEDICWFLDKIKFYKLKYFNILIFIFLLFISLKILNEHDFKNSHKEITSQMYPIMPIQFLIENNIKGKLFSPFHYNAYISYKTYPNIQTEIDGRQEQVYSEETFQNHLNFIFNMGINPYKNIETNKPDIYLHEKIYEFNKYIEFTNEYDKIYEDNQVNIYILKSLNTHNYKIPNKYSYYYLDDNVFKNNLNFIKNKK